MSLCILKQTFGLLRAFCTQQRKVCCHFPKTFVAPNFLGNDLAGLTLLAIAAVCDDANVMESFLLPETGSTMPLNMNKGTWPGQTGSTICIACRYTSAMYMVFNCISAQLNAFRVPNERDHCKVV